MLVRITHRTMLIVTPVLASVLISACGYKAPVYYPTPAQRQELKEKEERIKARKEARKAPVAKTQKKAESTTTQQQPNVQ